MTVSQQCPQPQIVNAAEREADMYDILLEAPGDAGVPGDDRALNETGTTAPR